MVSEVYFPDPSLFAWLCDLLLVNGLLADVKKAEVCSVLSKLGLISYAFWFHCEDVSGGPVVISEERHMKQTWTQLSAMEPNPGEPTGWTFY